MGTEQSNEEQNKKNEKDQECYNGFCYNVLSYRGMKSEGGSDKQSNHSSEKLSEKTTETTEKVSQKIPVLFEWNEGGNNVVLTGSFLNWEQFLQMTRNDKGVFQLILPLDPGVYQFKFIIDNNWRCSHAYPMIDDGSHNTNNLMDTNTYISKVKEDLPTTSSSSSPEQGNQLANDQGQSQSQPHRPSVNGRNNKTKDGYSCITPKKSEMNNEAPAIPFHYIQSFNIDHNTRQYSVGKRKYLNCNERDLLSENNSYKKILIIPHVNV